MSKTFVFDILLETLQDHFTLIVVSCMSINVNINTCWWLGDFKMESAIHIWLPYLGHAQWGLTRGTTLPYQSYHIVYCSVKSPLTRPVYCFAYVSIYVHCVFKCCSCYNKSGYPSTTSDLWPGAVTLSNPCLLPNIYHLKSIWLLEVQIAAKCQFNCQLTYCSVAIELSAWATDNFNTSRLTECRCEKHMLFENKIERIISVTASK